jgi:hypothetical protein
MKRFTLILIVLATQGCSSGGGNGDGGLPDGIDADGGDGYVVECSQEDVYCIVIEAGAQACGVFQDDREWSVELSNLARVSFKVGETLLPEDLTDMEADLVDRVEFGPDATELTPSGPGLITRTFNPAPNPPDSGYQTYEYVQRFEGGPEELTLSMNTDFWVEGGVPQRRATRIGARFSQYMYLTSLLGIDPNDNLKRQVYDSCDYGHYTLYIITAQTQNGDQVTFHKRMYSPDIRGGSMPANLESAQATVDGTTRSTDDYFSLVYSADHHNWNEGYTVLLRPPVGDVHGLVLVDADLNADPVEMLYLGSDLTEIRRSPLISYAEEKQ